MAHERRDIMVVRFRMQTRSNMKLRSYRLLNGSRKRVIRVLYFRNKNNLLPTSEYKSDSPIYFHGRLYNVPATDMGSLRRYM